MLFVFQNLVFRSEAIYFLVPDADQVAKNLKVSHFDYGSRTKNTVYALNQVRECHSKPERLEISHMKTILYTKYFRKKLNSTQFRTQHQRKKWHCRHDDPSSIAHTIVGITSDLMVSPDQCRSFARGKVIYPAD